MRRIGILGGTFNPVHMGHLTMANMVLEKFVLDKVIFVPSYLPPHKSGRNVITAQDRLKMVGLAIRDNRHLEISAFEIKKGGKSYTIDTIEHFRQRYPEARLFFIIGSDHIFRLHRWKRIDAIQKIASFIAVYRPGFKAVRSSIPVQRVMLPGVDISSSDIRHRLATGKTIEHLVPKNVFRYMKRHKLYHPREKGTA